MIKYVGLMMGGIALGVIIDRMVIAIAENKKDEKEKIVGNCFGERMYTSSFSLNEVRDWIKARQDKLENGAKAIILKANSETLHKIGKDLDIGKGIENNLVIAIVDETNKSISDSVLVRYESLDEKLEHALNNGKGVLVVEA